MTWPDQGEVGCPKKYTLELKLQHNDRLAVYVQMSKPTPKIRTRKFVQQTSNLGAATLKKQTPYKGLTGKGSTRDVIKLAMWNVNGIRSVLNKNAIFNFINQIQPDILCINQTKINKELFDKNPIELKGYSGYWNFCKVSAGYSGVAIFSKFLPISFVEDIDEPAYSQEGRVLTLEFQHFYLVAVYIPSAGDKKLQRLHYKTQVYEKAFHKYCQKLKKNGKGVIVCGDFNVCHDQIDIHFTPFSYKQPGFTPQQRKSFNNFLKMGWIDTFRKLNPEKKEYTWWRLQHGNRQRNIGKRLDYFLVNESFFPAVVQSDVLGSIMGSDHCPIYLKIDLGKLKGQSIKELKKHEKIKITPFLSLQPELQKKEETQQQATDLKQSQQQQEKKSQQKDDKTIKDSIKQPSSSEQQQKVQKQQNIPEQNKIIQPDQ